MEDAPMRYRNLGPIRLSMFLFQQILHRTGIKKQANENDNEKKNSCQEAKKRHGGTQKTFAGRYALSFRSAQLGAKDCPRQTASFATSMGRDTLPGPPRHCRCSA